MLFFQIGTEGGERFFILLPQIILGIINDFSFRLKIYVTAYLQSNYI